MCRGPRENGVEGGCLLFFRFLAILATIGGITLIALGASSWGQHELARSQQVDAYRAALESSTNPWYDTSKLPTATAQQGTGAVQTFTSQTSIVYPTNGDSNDVTGVVTTRLLTTTLFPWSPASPLSLSLTTTSTTTKSTDNLTVVIPFTKLLTAPISCDLISCQSDCSQPVQSCTNASLTRACQATYNTFAYYIGDDKCTSTDGDCGTCYYPAYLTTVCLVVASTDNGGYVFDRTMDSCFFPFTPDSQQYEATLDATLGTAVQRHVTVQLRSDNDPYIYLQRATLGKMYFPSRNVAVPSILIGIGIALIVSFWVGLGCCRAWQRRREKETEEYELQTTQAIPMAPYPTSHATVPMPNAAPPSQPQPVEGVLYGQGPIPVPLGANNVLRNPTAQAPMAPSDAETYPGVPLKPLHR